MFLCIFIVIKSHQALKTTIVWWKKKRKKNTFIGFPKNLVGTICATCIATGNPCLLKRIETSSLNPADFTKSCFECIIDKSVENIIREVISFMKNPGKQQREFALLCSKFSNTGTHKHSFFSLYCAKTIYRTIQKTIMPGIEKWSSLLLSIQCIYALAPSASLMEFKKKQQLNFAERERERERNFVIQIDTGSVEIWTNFKLICNFLLIRYKTWEKHKQNTCLWKKIFTPTQFLLFILIFNDQIKQRNWLQTSVFFQTKLGNNSNTCNLKYIKTL